MAAGIRSFSALTSHAAFSAACAKKPIQLTPDFELGEYKRQDLVYEKEDLLISGPGKYPEYNFYRMAGMAIDGKDKGEAENEAKPIDVKSLLP